MGNCCRPASSVDQWGGEDWSSLKSKNYTRKTSSSSKVFDEGHQGLSSLGNIVEKEKLFGALRASSDSNGTVKIKITKKELAELLGAGIEKQHLHNMKDQQVVVGRSTCAEQVLIRLIKAREHANQRHDSHHTPWRPVLHTIPEVD